MLGSELKKIRVKSGYNQIKFAKLLNVSQPTISNLEAGTMTISPAMENKLGIILDKETSTSLTKKIFSRELFLKDMLTGNEVIDEIYINADWLKKLDNSKIHSKGTRLLLNEFDIYKGQIRVIESCNNAKKPVIRSWNFRNVILAKGKEFYCKESWLINE